VGVQVPSPAPAASCRSQESGAIVKIRTLSHDGEVRIFVFSTEFDFGTVEY